MLLRFTDSKFCHGKEPTIGVEFGIRNVNVRGHKIKLQVWDTAGQERFLSIIRSYYRCAAGALLVYDVTRRETFDHIVNWIREVKQNSSQSVTMLLVGNKCDLADRRQVSQEEAMRFAAEQHLAFIETSAWTAENVDRAFLQTADEILAKIQSGALDPSSPGITVGAPADPIKRPQPCC